jgi:hypothetical protein
MLRGRWPAARSGDFNGVGSAGQIAVALQCSGQVLFRRQPDPGDAGSFLLLEYPTGHAERWRDRAALDGLTLRRAWPVYQGLEPEQQTEAVLWLGQSLLVLNTVS